MLVILAARFLPDCARRSLERINSQQTSRARLCVCVYAPWRHQSDVFYDANNSEDDTAKVAISIFVLAPSLAGFCNFMQISIQLSPGSGMVSICINLARLGAFGPAGGCVECSPFAQIYCRQVADFSRTPHVRR